MTKRYHFISGLPRAGSTLLSSILNQNPQFTAGISDPLRMYVHSIIRDTSTAVGMDIAIPISKRKEVIHGIFNSFYSDATNVCFNTNRIWTSDTALLADLFPNFKMIVCFRDIPWILDSFEQLNTKNPYTIKPLYHYQQLSSVYDRTNMLMGNFQSYDGNVKAPLASMYQSVFSNETRNILYVEYDSLVSTPEIILKQIYTFLEEPWFNHDFNNVIGSYDEFDNEAMIQGLHKVRPIVSFEPRTSILPADLRQQYATSNFWKYNFDHIKSNLNWVGTPSLNKSRQL